MSGELEKRASDAEREQAVERLRDASSEGRLTLEELEVELSGLFLIGDKSQVASEEELPPTAPRVHIRAFGLIGDLNVVRR